MPVFNKQALLSELIDRTELVKSNTQSFLKLENEQLNARPAEGKWSISEIFEHLIITHAIYIKSIIKNINAAPDVDSANEFTTGWLGNWLYDRIMPRTDGTVFKMKTPPFLRPQGTQKDAHEVLNEFLQQEDSILDILQHSSSKDLQKIKVPLSISRLAKIRLGDNLRFLIAHSERHLLQAQKTLQVISRSSD